MIIILTYSIIFPQARHDKYADTNIWKPKTKNLSIKSWMNKDPLVINSRTLVTKQNSENKGEKELSGILRSFSCSNQQKSVKNCVMRSYSHDPNNARRVHSKKITRTYSNNTKDITRTYSHNIETKTFSQDAKKERRPRSGKLLMQSWKRWVCSLISKLFLWELDSPFATNVSQRLKTKLHSLFPLSEIR